MASRDPAASTVAHSISEGNILANERTSLQEANASQNEEIGETSAPRISAAAKQSTQTISIEETGTEKSVPVSPPTQINKRCDAAESNAKLSAKETPADAIKRCIPAEANAQTNVVVGNAKPNSSSGETTQPNSHRKIAERSAQSVPGFSSGANVQINSQPRVEQVKHELEAQVSHVDTKAESSRGGFTVDADTQPISVDASTKTNPDLSPAEVNADASPPSSAIDVRAKANVSTAAKIEEINTMTIPAEINEDVNTQPIVAQTNPEADLEARTAVNTNTDSRCLEPISPKRPLEKLREPVQTQREANRHKPMQNISQQSQSLKEMRDMETETDRDSNVSVVSQETTMPTASPSTTVSVTEGAASPEPVTPKPVDWRTKSKQILILSESGKPVYYRYGTQKELLGTVGLVLAIISRCKCDSGHHLQHIVAGKRKIVFLVAVPLYLVTICTTDEPISFLKTQLVYIHNLLTFAVSAKTYKILSKRPNFDITNQLDKQFPKQLEHLLHMGSTTPFLLLNSFGHLPLPPSVRSTVTNAINSIHCKGLLFGLLTANQKVVSICHPRKSEQALDVEDIMTLIIFSLFGHGSNAVRQHQSWVPVCLPRYNAEQFLQAFVCFLAPSVCLMLISEDRSTDQFQKLSRGRDQIEDTLKQAGLLEAIRRSLDVGHRLVVPNFEIAGLKNFLYRCGFPSQCFQYCADTQVSNDEPGDPKVWSTYQYMHDKFHRKRADHPGGLALATITTGSQSKSHLKLCEINQHATTICLRGYDENKSFGSMDFELYAIFDPFVSASEADRSCDKIIRWIKENEGCLFAEGASWWRSS